MVKEPAFELEELSSSKLEALLERIQPLIAAEDFHLLQRVIATLHLLLDLIQKARLSMRRLRQLLFKPKTEKCRQILAQANHQFDSQTAAPGSEKNSAAPKAKRKGHGRNGVADYPGAQREFVPHPSLQPGCLCPLCQQGRLYDLHKPAPIMRVIAHPIFVATVYELMQLRCSGCLAVFTAPAPSQAGSGKYSESVPVMLAMLCYGSGLPLHRTEKLQQHFGIPLPSATQWELLRDAAQPMKPDWDYLVGLAPQAWLFYQDDTHMKVLSLSPESGTRTDGTDRTPERTGLFTTGIVAQVGEHRIALFFTGGQHAGENLERVLAERPEGLPTPIQMSDGLPSIHLKKAPTHPANCNAHCRRRYVEILDEFPEECRFVLESFKEVYRHDGLAKAHGLTPEERLQFHQTHSDKPMTELQRWAQKQLDDHKVEPNSNLGQAIKYMLKRWEKLTLFLRMPGAPLDNYWCEQLLKRAILRRKNSLFYRPEQGAQVGDLFMSLIETCRYCGANPLMYLTALLEHASSVQQHPEQWLPWNFQSALPLPDTT